MVSAKLVTIPHSGTLVLDVDRFMYLKRLRVLCSSIRLLLPVRSSSCRVAGSESGNWISVSSLQLRSTSWEG